MGRLKLFLDSCDPADTQKAIKLLGSIDGQTTNPTLLTKNPEIQQYLIQGKKLTLIELLSLYKQAIEGIARYTDGAISIEVYADWNTTASEMLKQAQVMQSWSSNGYIKFPTIPEGLKAANEFTKLAGHANMTLVFDQQQAAAVYSATRYTQGTSFVSPFVGRLDDRGLYGLDIIRNIRTMYDTFNKLNGRKSGHVEILAASIRTLDHMYGAIAFGTDIITAPISLYQQWLTDGSKIPTIPPPKPDILKHIDYEQIKYSEDFASYSIDRSETGLLNQGLMKFAKDWNTVIDNT